MDLRGVVLSSFPNAVRVNFVGALESFVGNSFGWAGEIARNDGALCPAENSWVGEERLFILC